MVFLSNTNTFLTGRWGPNRSYQSGSEETNGNEGVLHAR